MQNFFRNKSVFSSTALVLFVFAVAFLTNTFLLRPLLAQTLTSANSNPAANQLNENQFFSDAFKPATTNPVSAFAPMRNSELKNNIGWTFGGKTQRGWHIYESLVNQLIGSDAAATSNDFANALARWQQTQGVEANGVLDEAALSKIIAVWQANRLKIKGVAAEEDLLLAPSADFWSPERPAELRHIERETYAAYKKMVQAAAKDLRLATNADGNLADSEKFLKIISSFRSPEYQAKLRQASPNSGRAGLAVNSPHFTGRALDIYVGGEPVSTRDDNRQIQVNTPAYKWLVKNAHKFGFKPYFYEPWHWEYAPDETTRQSDYNSFQQ